MCECARLSTRQFVCIHTRGHACEKCNQVNYIVWTSARKGRRTTDSSGLGPPEPSPPMMRCITSLAMVMKALSTLMFDFAEVSKNLTWEYIQNWTREECSGITWYSSASNCPRVCSTFLFSTMSDLLPNKTLFTDSDACCEEKKESDAAGELGFN